MPPLPSINASLPPPPSRDWVRLPRAAGAQPPPSQRLGRAWGSGRTAGRPTAPPPPPPPKCCASSG